jgi:cell division protein FtsL
VLGRRRPNRLGFLVLATVVVGSMVLSLVALNTLIAQSSFRIDDLNDRLDTLARRNLELTSEQARMSAPGRIAAWARRNGMRLPDDIRFLHAHDEPAATPAGEPDDPTERAGAGR